jgi:hypothetical protein
MTDDTHKASPTPGSPQMIIAFLLDETGSMGSVRDATISGFNEYIETVRAEHPDALLSLRLFSSRKYDKVAQLTPLSLAPRLSYDNYAPGGNTPLYDCVARLIRETEDDTHALKPAPEVLFVIMTDGEENASREFNRERIFQLISAKQESGWTFVFLGANQDAWQVGGSIGVGRGSSMTYDANAAGVVHSFHMMSEATMRHMDKRLKERAADPTAAPTAEPEFFTDEDAEKLGKKRPPTDKP